MSTYRDPVFLAQFGARVRQLRNERGLSVVELARRTGLAPSTIATIENGARPTQLDTFCALAKALGVGSMDLMNAAPEHDDRAFVVEALRTTPDALLVVERHLGPAFKPRASSMHRDAPAKPIH